MLLSRNHLQIKRNFGPEVILGAVFQLHDGPQLAQSLTSQWLFGLC